MRGDGVTWDDALVTAWLILALLGVIVAVRLAWREMHRPDVDPNTLAPHDRLVHDELEAGHDDVNGHS